jgi:hypothetical protein
MPNVREYFDTDMTTFSIGTQWQAGTEATTRKVDVLAKRITDLDGNAKYWSFFFPSGLDTKALASKLFAMPQVLNCKVFEPDDVSVELGIGDYPVKMDSTTLVFTKRIFLYTDVLLPDAERVEIAAVGAQHGFHVIVRDRKYASVKSAIDKPLAFISHDSADKDALVRDLAVELTKISCFVWYDEFSLKVGDSLRASIERGLKETRNCIVILSRSFLANKGWAKAEFDSVYTREILEKGNVFLPVWHNVSVKEIYEYSPRMADKVGLNSSLGIPELARRLSAAVKASGAPDPLERCGAEDPQRC